MMRKTLIALLFASTLPVTAMAMPDAGQHHDGKHAPHMFQQLDLSKEQQRDMRKLMREQMKSRHEITQRYLDMLPEAERKAMKDELKASHAETRDNMRALLQPEQQKQFDEIHKKMQEKRAERSEKKSESDETN